jgi:hypothetical protein
MPETPNTLEELLAQTGDTGQGNANGGGLRAVLEQTLAELNRVKAENAQFAQAQQASARSALFAKHGIPELAQDFFPADSPLTDEAATAFVGKYGQLWGGQSAGETPAAPATPAATTPVADQQAAAAMQGLTSTAPATELKTRSEAEYRALFAGANTQAELNVLLEQAAQDLAGLGL